MICLFICFICSNQIRCGILTHSLTINNCLTLWLLFITVAVVVIIHKIKLVKMWTNRICLKRLTLQIKSMNNLMNWPFHFFYIVFTIWWPYILLASKCIFGSWSFLLLLFWDQKCDARIWLVYFSSSDNNILCSFIVCMLFLFTWPLYITSSGYVSRFLAIN